MTILPVYIDSAIVLQGSDFYYPIQLTNPDGTLVDLSGKTFAMQARLKKNSPEPFMNLTTENGGIILNTITLGGEDYNMQLYLAAAATAEIAPTPPSLPGVWDMKMFTPGSPVQTDTILYGPLPVIQEVTR